MLLPGMASVTGFAGFSLIIGAPEMWVPVTSTCLCHRESTVVNGEVFLSNTHQSEESIRMKVEKHL